MESNRDHEPVEPTASRRTEARRYPTTRDEVIVFALARGMTQREAAAEAGVSERTVRRRVADATFMSRVGRARAGLYESAMAQASAEAIAALNVIKVVMHNAGRPADQLAAARLLLGLGSECFQTYELVAKFDELSNRVNHALEILDEESE